MMGTTKLVVGCFAGTFSAVVGFGITHDWLKRKTYKSKSGVKDTPEPEGQVDLESEDSDAED